MFELVVLVSAARGEFAVEVDVVEVETAVVAFDVVVFIELIFGAGTVGFDIKVLELNLKEETLPVGSFN